ncbi:hypothetical protein Misp01_52870 [Microtetraspora sp. NBRC 13810]|nr:hypothetical protein Misp01_52870 [Microtetraspora sp. NBRC 13810]
MLCVTSRPPAMDAFRPITLPPFPVAVPALRSGTPGGRGRPAVGDARRSGSLGVTRTGKGAAVRPEVRVHGCC